LNEIKVSKDQLLEVVRTNRDKHRQVFEAALEGYHQAAAKWLGEKLDEAKKGNLRDQLVFREPVPTDHTADYDRVIRMLEMALGDTIKVPEHEFSMFVMDEWGWKREWMATASNYTTV
jgi:hypothetical protein